MARQLVGLVLSVLFAVAVVRSLWPRGSADEVRFRRRRAEWTTVAFAVVGAWLVLLVVRALAGPDGPNPVGLIPFLLLCAHAVASWVVLRRVWRAVASTATATDKAVIDAADAPARRHGGLSGEVEPPRRW